MTFTEKIRNDFVHLKTLAKHNSLWIAANDTIVDRNEDTASFGSFSVISEYIILI
jgi:hypothetical protein